MAKAQRLTTSRSERYLGTYSGQSYGNGVSEASSEFHEEDVWSAVDGGGVAGYGYNHASYYEDGEAGSEWPTRAVTTTPPPIPPRNRPAGGLTVAFEVSAGRTTSSRIAHQPPPRRPRLVASSAPVNVPDWNKILRANSVESMHDSDSGEFEDERNSAVDPPHEYLARSRKNSTSVFEGVGRTLKGRDLRRLRDAVWSQTGFDG